jgi:DNA-binding response OmpR family regulator
LTSTEFAVLRLLASSEGKNISAEYIYEKVWAQPIARDKNAVQAVVSKVRKKIKPTGYDINMVRGQGYVFEKA